MFLCLDSMSQYSSTSKKKAQIHLIFLSVSTNPTSALGHISEEQYDQTPTWELNGRTCDFREWPCGFQPLHQDLLAEGPLDKWLDFSLCPFLICEVSTYLTVSWRVNELHYKVLRTIPGTYECSYIIMTT